MLCVGSKNVWHLFDRHDELYHHAKFGEDRSRAIFLLTGQKSGFSPRRSDSLHRFMSNLAEPTGTWVRLALEHITSMQRGGNEAPKCQKIPLFVNESPVATTPLTNF